MGEGPCSLLMSPCVLGQAPHFLVAPNLPCKLIRQSLGIRQSLSSKFLRDCMASLELVNSPQLHKIADLFPKTAPLPGPHPHMALNPFKMKIKKYVPFMHPSAVKTKLGENNC